MKRQGRHLAGLLLCVAATTYCVSYPIFESPGFKQVEYLRAYWPFYLASAIFAFIALYLASKFK